MAAIGATKYLRAFRFHVFHPSLSLLLRLYIWCPTAWLFHATLPWFNHRPSPLLQNSRLHAGNRYRNAKRLTDYQSSLSSWIALDHVESSCPGYILSNVTSLLGQRGWTCSEDVTFDIRRIVTRESTCGERGVQCDRRLVANREIVDR